MGDGTVSVWSTAPLTAATLLDAEGVPLARATLPEPRPSVTLAVPASAAAPALATVEVTTAGGLFQAPAAHRLPVDVTDAHAPLWVALAAPVGSVPVRVRDGDTLPVAVIDGAPALLGLSIRTRGGGTVEVSASSAPTPVATQPGVRAGLEFLVGDDTPLVIATPGESVTILLDAVPTTLDALRSRLRLEAVDFPATEDGRRDIVRTPGRIVLPSRWWATVLDHTPLGVRARDVTTPWAFAGATFRNEGEAPVDLVVRSRVVTESGETDPAFRPTMRDADDGTGNTSVFLRVPAHGVATAALPVFVDERALGNGPWRVLVEAMPAGLAEPLVRQSLPVYLSRGSSAVSLGFALALGGAVAGTWLVATRLRTWLAAPTAQLVTIALFASVQFVVGTVAQIVGLGVAAAAGPFATMVTSVFDDAFGVTLMATLVTLLPRPGTVALSTLLAWGLRGLATGAMSPLDFLFVGCRVAFYEGALYAVGLTRGAGHWRSGARAARLARMALGFGLASLLATLTSLVLHTVLYRLFYAPWYVAMLVVGPGLLYPALAVGIADRVAQSLRRVED